MSNSALVNLGELSKPATVLIEKVSEAVGGICKPWQIVRVAKAEAEADRIRAESQIQITDLQRRAMQRFLVEEGRKQANIEEITAGALPLLKEDSKPQNVNDDWITNFFDKGRIISDAQMQQLWSRLLAGEANTPGTFSRRTVNLVSDLDKRDAELFTNLCGFSWVIGDLIPLVFEFDAEPYKSVGITFASLSHLEALGLIHLGTVTGFSRWELPSRFGVFYYGTPVTITFPPGSQNRLPTGRVLFTKAGKELSTVCESKPVDGFLETVCDKWKGQVLTVERGTIYGA